MGEEQTTSPGMDNMTSQAMACSSAARQKQKKSEVLGDFDSIHQFNVSTVFFLYHKNAAKVSYSHTARFNRC